jgi:hypothetical protein
VSVKGLQEQRATRSVRRGSSTSMCSALLIGKVAAGSVVGIGSVLLINGCPDLPGSYYQPVATGHGQLKGKMISNEALAWASAWSGPTRNRFPLGGPARCWRLSSYQ